MEMDENKINSKDQWLINTSGKTWGSISELHEEIMAVETFQNRYFIEGIFTKKEEYVEELMKKIEEKIANNGNPNQYDKNRLNMQLPKIKLPMFDGNCDQWFTFHDIFQKVIHESSCLTIFEKMQYLKKNVRGEASQMIKHLGISEHNYQSAWDILKKRYQNKRKLVATLVDKILDLPVRHNEVSNKLKELHDVIMECINAMTKIGIDTGSWGPMLTRIVMRKWNTNTNNNRLNEYTLNSSSAGPSTSGLSSDHPSATGLSSDYPSATDIAGPSSEIKYFCPACNEEYSDPPSEISWWHEA
ncbi:unnamed protein product [Psylliodes chrysocephalus]|uniref:Uncharacterized protein n=1 Tax=Psylliodes chrysocephalus TaxID=3402493 RepID=A0A9P0CRB1_9CUCU|nr:unnamed protein product [Psylliodes chrysocephala]